MNTGTWESPVMHDPEKLDEAEADRRRDEGLRQMLNTPPQPRKKKGREPKPAPKESGA